MSKNTETAQSYSMKNFSASLTDIKSGFQSDIDFAVRREKLK